MCCTAYVATIVAGVLSIFQSFANLSWNIPILISLGWNETRMNPVIAFNAMRMENPFGIFGITMILSFLNLLLLVFSCLMLKANANLRTGWIGAWCIVILIQAFFQSVIGSYYFYKYCSGTHYRTKAYFRLAALFSGVFFFWPAINLVFCAFVLKRYRDISKSDAPVDIVDRSTSRQESLPPPYTPGSFLEPQRNTVDPAPVSGWSDEPLLRFDDISPIEIATNRDEH
ncbi:uncharacterized protein LOC129218452 [Uloborus diversus]|uniref:uncharacterized protein LOC129218452 n=1 Tax=Uloborus diversus TaxID=327109 RepID=UPI002409581C|nr:uncharacterized protein LOC129218452 [Uloborus diversus]